MSCVTSYKRLLLALCVAVALTTLVTADIWISSTGSVAWSGKCSTLAPASILDDSVKASMQSENCTRLDPCTFPKDVYTTVKGACVINIMAGDYRLAQSPSWFPSFSDNTSTLTIIFGGADASKNRLTEESKVENLGLLMSIEKSRHAVPNILISGPSSQVPVVLRRGSLDLSQSWSANFQFSDLIFQSNRISFTSDKKDIITAQNNATFSRCRFEYETSHAISVSSANSRPANKPFSMIFTKSTMIGEAGSTFMNYYPDGASIVFDESTFNGFTFLDSSNIHDLTFSSTNITSNASSLVKCDDFGEINIIANTTLQKPNSSPFYVFPKGVPKDIGKGLANLVWMDHVELERVVLRGALPNSTDHSGPSIQHLTCHDCHLDFQIGNCAKLVAVRYSVLSEIGGLYLTRSAHDYRCGDSFLDLNMYVNETQQSSKPFVFADRSGYREFKVGGKLTTNVFWLHPPINLIIDMEVSQLIGVTDPKLGRPTLTSYSQVTLSSIQVVGVDLNFAFLPRLYYNVTNPMLGIATTPGGNLSDGFSFLTSSFVSLVWDVPAPPDFGVWYPLSSYVNTQPIMVSESFKKFEFESKFDRNTPEGNRIWYRYLPQNFNLPPNSLPCASPPKNFTCVHGYYVAFKPIDTDTIVFPSNPAIAYANITASQSITFQGYEGVKNDGLNSTACIKTPSFILDLNDIVPDKVKITRRVAIAQQHPDCPSILDVPFSVKQNPKDCAKISISRSSESNPSRLVVYLTAEPCKHSWKWIALGVLTGLLAIAFIVFVVSLLVSRYRLRKLSEEGYAPIQ